MITAIIPAGFLNVPYQHIVTLSGLTGYPSINQNFYSKSGLIAKITYTKRTGSQRVGSPQNTPYGTIINGYGIPIYTCNVEISGTPLTTDPGSVYFQGGYTTNPNTQWESSATINNVAVIKFSRIGISPISITTLSLPDGETSKPYSQQLEAVGTQPITWSIASGSLPPGLSLDPSTGIISGTPLSSQQSQQ